MVHYTLTWLGTSDELESLCKRSGLRLLATRPMDDGAMEAELGADAEEIGDWEMRDLARANADYIMDLGRVEHDGWERL